MRPRIWAAANRGNHLMQDVFAAIDPHLPRVFEAARAERIFESLGDSIAAVPKDARTVFASAFGNSPYLCRLALRERELLHEIWEVGPDEIVERAIAASRQAHGATDAADAMSVLRRAKCRMALATAMADIAGIWNVETVTNRLTRFADASVGGALRFLLREAARKMELPELDPEKLEKETG